MIKWMSIKKTAKETGLSEYFLRQMLKDGSLPHVKSGVKVLVNVDRLMIQLDSEAMSIEGIA